MLAEIISILILASSGLSNVIYNASSYWEQRQQIMERDITNMIGNDIILTDLEKEVNALLTRSKIKEINYAYNTSNVLQEKHFFLAKSEIEASDVFKFIKKMPKGAILHCHDMAISPMDWVISELTYWPNLYMCYLPNDRITFKYFKTPDSTCDWCNVQKERANYMEPQIFDSLLKHHLSIITDNPEQDLPSLNKAWQKFNNAFESLAGILGFDAAWKAYLVRALEFLVSDNVQYLEFRGVIFPLYDLEGKNFSATDIIKVYEDVITNFTANNMNDFHGARFIYGPVRSVTTETVKEYLRTAALLITEFPEFVAGFDLVGQEDKGRPLRDFIEPLLEIQKSNVTIKTFFHAGETNWQGTDSDENLIDAILLNTTRIGHGYAITKHPYLMELVKKRDIPIEICPISNQILKLVKDLRNHPMAALVVDNFPLVISSDDPGLWGADPLSHDFYEAFFALGGAKADLRFLKKLALNSIRYSSLDEDKKDKLEALWKTKWDIFLNEILESDNKGKSLNYYSSNETAELEENNYIY